MLEYWIFFSTTQPMSAKYHILVLRHGKLGALLTSTYLYSFSSKFCSAKYLRTEYISLVLSLNTNLTNSLSSIITITTMYNFIELMISYTMTIKYAIFENTNIWQSLKLPKLEVFVVIALPKLIVLYSRGLGTFKLKIQTKASIISIYSNAI